MATILGLLVPMLLLLLVVWKGTLRHSRPYFQATLLALSGLLVGFLFKIQHRESAVGILLASGLLLIGSYGLWFARKTNKTRLDFLKLALVVTMGAWAIGLGFSAHGVLRWLNSLRSMAFWAVLLDFGYVTFIHRPARA
ncbi:hypothetical protein LGH70_16200 [Hymenobacter sp. BT635]|uniref:DUF2306 domain-containing protein n=1 Tax=Hymenobacter nitidus TaxID=2880929 RepID=A0ABS8AI27_9BACT|nr:hypothetical protein [Hymenobacter nitidus]MCB2379144.1 hypothetical protein [Hymenobacter nitidus]